MKIRNLVMEGSDQELRNLLDDYKFIGYDAEVKNGQLTVFCVNRKLKSRKVKAREAKAARKAKAKLNKAT